MGKYEEALERAKAGKPLDEVFPELNESEDEKIINEIIAFIGQAIHSGGDTLVEKEKEDRWITYLEGWKEQKSISIPKGGNSVMINRILHSLHLYRDMLKDSDYEVDYVKATIEQCLEDEKWINQLNIEQQPAEWSEEDEEKLDRIISLIHCYTGTVQEENELKTFLKSLRPQPKEDLNAIAQREYARGKQDGYWGCGKAELESYKIFHYESPNWPPKMPDLPTETTTNEGISSPQPHWKPSEKQINMLKVIVGREKEKPLYGIDGYSPAAVLESLYTDLQKLF